MNIEMEHLYMKCAHVFEIWKYQSIQVKIQWQE